jgi:hypothetical protein
MIDYAQLFADITSKEIAVGFFPGPRQWSASALRTLPCGCNYIATEYAATLPDAVSKCLGSWELLECNGEGCEGEPPAPQEMPIPGAAAARSGFLFDKRGNR